MVWRLRFVDEGPLSPGGGGGEKEEEPLCSVLGFRVEGLRFRVPSF